jgi:folate-binding protein YgfZ
VRDLHEDAGAIFGVLRGVDLPRRYADPAAEYRAGVEGVAVRDRSHRARLRAQGRKPGAMLAGIVTGRLPAALDEVEPGVWAGVAEPSAVLTPKGRVIATLRLWREPGSDEVYALDVPRTAAAPLLEHLGRVLPPRFARVEDVSEATGMPTVLGPDAPPLLARDVLGLRADAGALAGMHEGELRALPDGVTVVRSGEVDAPAWDVLADRTTVRALWRRLLELGAAPLGSGVWEALRLEAGRAAFGADVDADTLLNETGLETRVIDHAKGCYTGQEVVVRIRDRGHVNRHLRRLRLGDAPTPAAGTELYPQDGERAVGHVTSAAASPRLGTLALAYVRREVEPGGRVRVGGPAGVEAVVEALNAGTAGAARPRDPHPSQGL